MYYRKDMKDKEKAGTLKEVIAQISHSKKWPIKTPVERDGATIQVNSYSLLQDRYHEHMVAAGFPDLHRGERGSAAEHLTVEEYKYQQEKKRVEEAAALADAKEKEAAALEEQARKTKARVDNLNEQITVKEKAKATIKEVDGMGKPQTIGNGFVVTADELKKLKTLAKKTVNADKQIADSKKKMAELDTQITDLNEQLRDAKIEVNHWHREYTDLWNEVKEFIGAIRKFPARMREFVAELFRPERETARRREQEQIQQPQQPQKTKKKSYGQEI